MVSLTSTKVWNNTNASSDVKNVLIYNQIRAINGTINSTDTNLYMVKATILTTGGVVNNLGWFWKTQGPGPSAYVDAVGAFGNGYSGTATCSTSPDGHLQIILPATMLSTNYSIATTVWDNNSPPNIPVVIEIVNKSKTDFWLHLHDGVPPHDCTSSRVDVDWQIVRYD